MPSIELIYSNPDNGNAVLVLSNGDHIQKSVTIPELVNEWCICCGSTLEGRMSSTRVLLGIKNKVPIIIGNGWCVIFPTKGIYNEECVWIIFSRVQKFKRFEKDTLMVTVSGNEYHINVSQRTFSTQMNRCRDLIRALAKGHKDAKYFTQVYLD